MAGSQSERLEESLRQSIYFERGRMTSNGKVVSIVAVVVIVAALTGYLVGIGQRVPSERSTVTSTSTSTVTRTVLTHEWLFGLSFNQTAKCPNLGFIAPWSVTLSDGTSITEPPNGNFSECCSASPENPSSITFYVPSGVYSFQIKPNLLFSTNASVTVSNKDVEVAVFQTLFSCGSTTAPQS